MNLFRLIWLNFIKARPKSNLCLVAAVAIAAATISASSMVGFSVRQSLKKLAIQRLGDVDQVAMFADFVSENIAEKLTEQNPGGQYHTAIFTTASAVGPDNISRCNSVQIHAAANVEVPRGGCVINTAAAEMLSATVGDEILLSITKNKTISASSALTGLKRSEQLGKIRVDVTKIERENNFISRFEIFPTQRTRPVIWLALADLQRAANAMGKINCILAIGLDEQKLQAATSAADFGVVTKIDPPSGNMLITSKAVHLPAAIQKNLTGGQYNRVLTGLLKSAKSADFIDHYALASGMDLPPGGPLADNAAAVNRWLAERLKIAAGDDIELQYFARGPDGSVVTKAASLSVSAIVPTAAAGYDDSLTPTYPGMTDQAASSPSEWKIPGGLDIDLTLVDDDEENYWDSYRAAPRIFVSYETAETLWGEGQTATSIRVSDEAAHKNALKLLDSVNPAEFGAQVLPVRQLQLQAAKGSSDFNSLFLSLSGLIYIVAFILVLLVAMLTKRSMQAQFDIMHSLGYEAKLIIRMFNAESLLACCVAAAVSVPVSIAFAAGIMWALGNIWIGATGTTELEFVASGRLIFTGIAAAVVISQLICMSCYRDLGKSRKEEQKASTHRGKPKSILASKSTGAFNGSQLIKTLRLSIARPGERASLAILTLLMGLSVYGAVLALFFSMPSGNTALTDRLIVTDLSAPLPVLPDSSENRRLLGFSDNFEKMWQSAQCLGVKIQPGESLSCTNMTRPTQPTIAAIFLNSQASQSGQSQSVLKKFSLLEPMHRFLLPAASNGKNIKTPAAIADTASAQYILKKSVGDFIAITDSTGLQTQLQLTGTFKTNCFDGELLIGQSDFEKLFTATAGFNRLLVTTDGIDGQNINLFKKSLAEALADYGPQISTLTELTTRRAELQNTYLAAFRSLGVIAAALGVCGLWLSGYRGLLDRKRQLATMWIMGINRQILLVWAIGSHILAVLTGFGAAFIASLPLLAVSYVNTDKILTAICCGAGFVIATVIVQVIMTYKFIGKLDARSVCSE